MSYYASTALGAEWIPDQADCVDSGGQWTAGVARPCNSFEPRCLAAGGKWDQARLICTTAEGNEVDVRKVCAEHGSLWDEQHEVCFHPYTPESCPQAGGFWDAAEKACLREAAPPQPTLSKSDTTALIVTGGVVLVGLGLLFYVR